MQFNLFQFSSSKTKSIWFVLVFNQKNKSNLFWFGTKTNPVCFFGICFSNKASLDWWQQFRSEVAGLSRKQRQHLLKAAPRLNLKLRQHSSKVMFLVHSQFYRSMWGAFKMWTECSGFAHHLVCPWSRPMTMTEAWQLCSRVCAL